jgi:flagellar biosynthesis protein FlhF
MIIKKFIAPTMPEALAKVKKELGEQAVILKTRMNRKGGGADGAKSVEVTAAIERDQKPRFETPKPEIPAMPVVNSRLEEFQDEPLSSSTGTAVELPSEKLEALIKEIADFKKILQENSRNSAPKSVFGNFSSAMLEIGRELISRNLSEELVFAIISRLAGDENALALDKAEIMNRVQQALHSLIPAGTSIMPAKMGRTVVILVGMSGSGKTSAIARIATHFKVENNVRVAIITTDNFRADSSHQVKSICRILDCPCGIVYTPEELSTAIKSQAEGLLLIDTPGVSPGDSKGISEVCALAHAARADEIHLVVTASTPARDVKKIIVAFEEFGIDRILLTKLDETEAPGGVITAAIESQKPFSYMTSSREIPGRFGVVSPEVLADALTSQSEITKTTPEWEMEAVGIWQ